jgi:hypothetical protein
MGAGGNAMAVDENLLVDQIIPHLYLHSSRGRRQRCHRNTFRLEEADALASNGVKIAPEPVRLPRHLLLCS